MHELKERWRRGGDITHTKKEAVQTKEWRTNKQNVSSAYCEPLIEQADRQKKKVFKFSEKCQNGPLRLSEKIAFKENRIQKFYNSKKIMSQQHDSNALLQSNVEHMHRP